MESSLIDQLNNEHLKELIKTPTYNIDLDLRERYDVQKNKKEISLNLKNRKIEKEERQSWALNIENKRRASLNLEIFSSYEAMENYNDAKETDDDKKYDIDVDDDYLLNEGTQMFSDYATFSQNTFLKAA